MDSFMQKSLNDIVWNPRFYFMDADIADMHNEYQNEQNMDKKSNTLEQLKAFIAKYKIPYYKEVLKELESPLKMGAN